jgi:hypothetical protein
LRCWLRGGVCRRTIWLDFYPYHTLSLISIVSIPESDIGHRNPFSFSSGPRILYPVPPVTYPQNQRAVKLELYSKKGGPGGTFFRKASH